MKAKVYIVEDHRDMRESLRKLLEYEGDLEVCGDASSIHKALEGIQSTSPDLALVDLELGQHTGMDLIAQLKQNSIKVPVLILSMHSETLYAEPTIYQGARGYLMKSVPPDEIVHAVRQVLKGNIYRSSSMIQRLQSQERIIP
jgi:DNA-binding NarL/FixJ family response regulator